jgi:hypothetical protein
VASSNGEGASLQEYSSLPSRSFAFEMALNKPVFNLSPVEGLEQDQKTGM